MEHHLLNTTRGICPICNSLVDAKIYEADNRVYMEKFCLLHGKHTALVSSDYRHYIKSYAYIRPGQRQIKNTTAVRNGCPEDCGLCPDHEQHICMPVIEITGDCNLNCPICIADETDRKPLTLDNIKQMVHTLLVCEGKIDVVNISGGEPTLHPQYREIMKYLLEIDNITKISVSTNGLTLLSDPDLLDFHKKNDILISLQLDGCRKSVYETLRGCDLYEKKQDIVNLLVDCSLPFTLIATIGKNINDTTEDIRYLLDLFFKHEKIISLLFQPLVYKRQFSKFHDIMDRITIPDVIRLLADASSGNIREDDFVPLPCCHANCFSLAHFLQYDEKHYIPFKRMLAKDRYIDTIKNQSFFGSDEESFEQIRDAIFELWVDDKNTRDSMQDITEKSLKAIKEVIKEIYQPNDCGCGFTPRNTFNVASKKIKSIYIHHFMDADTFDLTRVRRCCTIYPKPDGRFYPLCSYNNLYRNRKGFQHAFPDDR